MNDLKQLFDPYNICARFAPGFLFIVSIYFLLGYDITNLKDNSIFFIALLVILSGVCGFVSAAFIKIAERKLWKLTGNPTIRHLKKKEKSLYQELLEKHKNNKDIMTDILQTTRDDNKLFWKNIAYGFFRNSILLSLACFSFSHTKYFITNLIVSVAAIIMTFVCAKDYARQAIKSYQEAKHKG